MAEAAVRKSSRIKTRKSYTEDDFDFDYDIHFYDSGDMSNILEPQTQQKNKNSLGKKRKSLSSMSKKSDRKSHSRKSEIKSSEDCEQRTFGDVITHGNNNISSLEVSDIACPISKVLLASDKEMEDHMIQHQSDTEKECLVCDICNRICGDQASYDRHVKSHSSDKKFKCEICDKAFTESCSLKRHLKSHDDDRPFMCDLCFKSFRDNPSLIRHQKTHTDRPRMFQCRKCDKNFADKHTLKRHERSHTGLRPFECNTCFKTFSELGSFKRHLKIHTGVRNYVCPVCSRSFLEKQSLLRHQKNVCGFGDSAMVGNAALHGSFSIDFSHDSHDSGGDNSEVSHASFADGGTNIMIENLINHHNVKISSSSTVSPKSYRLTPDNNNLQSIDPTEKSKTLYDPKDTPSLHSLIQKDPKLYDSISEIVERIDSYEKMLDLCGETGQVEIDAALTREPVQMADNLLCFECGEPLVNGENFKSEGKTFHPRLCNSCKCLNCGDNDDDYGEPPVLTAEILTSGLSPLNRENNNNNNDTDEKQLCNLEYEKHGYTRNSLTKNVFGTDETIEHLRERLRTQHGVLYFGNMYYNDDDESSSNDQEITGSNATSSRTHSTDSEVGQILDKQDEPIGLGQTKKLAGSAPKLDEISNLLSKKSSIKFSATKGQEVQSSVVPKMDYEADDVNIPSVFPCHLCPKVFATSAFLARHLDLHRNTPYKCLVCGKTFTNSPSLRRHMTTHTGEKPYTCPHCSRKFRDPSNFSKHKKVCSASQLVSSPADSILSTSSVSSVQSFDDSSQGGLMGVCMADMQQKPSPLASTIIESKTPVSQDTPPRFSDESDEGEDLPVRFSHSPIGSDTPAEPKQFSGGDTTVRIPLENHLLQKDDLKAVKEEADKAGSPIPCTVCEKTFENKQFLEMHMKYHSGDPKVTCIECGKSFADSFGLKRHLRIHAGVRPYVCEYCERGYCDNWSLRKHKSRGCVVLEIKVPLDLLHPCSQCTRVFSEIEYLEEHMKTHKGLLKFECDICQRKFTEASNLKRHRRLHMAICPGCDKEFKDVQSLGEHQEKECPVIIPQPDGSKVRGFTCAECGRVYATKAYLERHKKFHSGLKPYVCEICDKRFSESFRLRRHLKVHNDDRPFNCEACGKRFTDMGSLKRHNTISSCSYAREQQLQHGAVEFPCHFCDKIFFKNYLLARHMTVHSEERPFACDQCGRTYKDTSSLRRHQLVHRGVRNFICPICGKDFFYSDSLKRHVSNCTGKKPRAHRRPRGQGKRRSSSTKKKNIGKDVINPEKEQLKTPSEQTLITKKKPLKLLKIILSDHTSVRYIKNGYWSCYNRRHCWRCNLKFSTTASFLKHSRIHFHKKPYQCMHCFSRWSRKLYWKAHLKTHKSNLREQHTSELTPVQPAVPDEEFTRLRRSVSRTRCS